jgi:hypothetical protein
MENQVVENKAPEDQKLSLEEITDWSHKALDEICSNVDVFAAMTEEQRKHNLLSKGFPPELFTEPTHFYFLAEMFYEAASLFIDDLFEYAVIQNFKDGYKTNLFVHFMRFVTWESFAESLLYTDLAREIEHELYGTVRKPRKGKHTIPFWFRNFDKQPVKDCIYNTVERIKSTLESADEYMRMYINALRQQNAEEPKNGQHIEHPANRELWNRAGISLTGLLLRKSTLLQ